VDTLHHLIGGWQDEEIDTWPVVWSLVRAMAAVHLDSGRDVVLPQYFAKVEEIAGFETLARDHEADFSEVVLIDDRDAAIERFNRRAQDSDDRWIRQHHRLIGGPVVMGAMYDDLMAVVRLRTGAVVVSAAGAVRETYELAGGRLGPAGLPVTRFSVIVPVQSAEAFVDECLRLVRCQAGAELEIIAVDDDSRDRSGAILDRHAEEDDRVTALHLTRSQGAGPARNEAIVHARGDYPLFLDADDAYCDDDVLAGLDADLAATGDPDILLFHYEERRPCGLSRHMRIGRVAAPDGPRTVSAAERPDVRCSSWVCWNKAYRRDFVAAAGLRFPPGYYEDFAWSVPAMFAAGRLAVSERLGVRYRRCRTTSVSRRPSPRHFEVFDQFELFLAFLAAHPEFDSAEARRALATSTRTFLRSRTERLHVVPAELVDEFRRRTVDVTARMGGEFHGRRRDGGAWGQ
jgi:glycosyltransferase involved in cell wall biosynthesis